MKFSIEKSDEAIQLKAKFALANLISGCVIPECSFKV